MQSSQLDGSDVRNVVIKVAQTPQGLALDPVDGMIYWTDLDVPAIVRADLQGNNVEYAVTEVLPSFGVAIDFIGRRVYWMEWHLDDIGPVIQRSELDGNNVEPVLLAGNMAPIDLALDLPNGKMYWTDLWGDRIWRANLDGTDFEDVLVTGLAPSGIALDANGKLYWSDTTQRTIHRANVDGTGIELVVPPSSEVPTDVDVDIVAEKLYWTLRGGVDRIMRADLDGSNPEVFTAPAGLSWPTGVVVDSTAGYVFFADGPFDSAGSIWRANMEDSLALKLVEPSTFAGRQIALDPNAEQMYWYDCCHALGRIQRVNLDGSDLQMNLVPLGIINGAGVAVDLLEDRIYWAERSGGRIRSTDLDGTNIEFVLGGLQEPRGIAIDPAARKMYWSDSEARKIQRANLDGTGVEDLVIEGIAFPLDVALDLLDRKLYWADSELDVVMRANLDGSGVEDVVYGGDLRGGIAVDMAGNPLTGRRIYWTEPDSIWAARMDGSNVAVVYEQLYTLPRGIAVDRGPDCQPNGIPDVADLFEGISLNCNANGIPDECDIVDGTSEDCNNNLVPDECEPDCNGNGVADSCDVSSGSSEDCNSNGAPDECDISEGGSTDCNANEIPDDCEADADADGTIDVCDGCPQDPTKTSPGICGCGVADVDTDFDTVPDCVDQCQGQDDLVDENENGAPDCVEEIDVPTTSTWGLAALALLFLITAKLRLNTARRPRALMSV